MRRPALRSLFAAALAIAAAPAPAQSEKPLWELGLGAAGLRLPHYRGSDQARNWLLPVPYIVYRGEIFKADRDGARAVLVNADRFDFDLSVSASAPTDSEDNVAREGMPDLKPTIEIGPNLSFTAARGAGWKLDLRLPVRAVVTLESSPQAIGWSSTPNLNLDSAAIVPGWNLGLQTGPVFGSRKLHEHYYGVDPAYANATRPAYRAPGGYGGWQATAAMSRRFENVWVGAFLKLDALNGAAFEQSPLVREKRQFSFGVAVSYVFATSSRRIAVPNE